MGKRYIVVPCVEVPKGEDFDHHPDCENHPKNKSGPSTVATDEYRRWDSIFGQKQPRGQA